MSCRLWMQRRTPSRFHWSASRSILSLLELGSFTNLAICIHVLKIQKIKIGYTLKIDCFLTSNNQFCFLTVTRIINVCLGGWFLLAHPVYCLPGTSPSGVPVSLGDTDPVLYMFPCAPTNPLHKWHLDWFSFLQGSPSWQIDRQVTLLCTFSVALGRIHMLFMRCSLKSDENN